MCFADAWYSSSFNGRFQLFDVILLCRLSRRRRSSGGVNLSAAAAQAASRHDHDAEDMAPLDLSLQLGFYSIQTEFRQLGAAQIPLQVTINKSIVQTCFVDGVCPNDLGARLDDAELLLLSSAELDDAEIGYSMMS